MNPLKVNIADYFDSFITVGYVGDELTLDSVLWVSIWWWMYGLNISIRPGFNIDFVNLRDYL